MCTGLVPRAGRSDGSFDALTPDGAPKDLHFGTDLTYCPVLSGPRFD